MPSPDPAGDWWIFLATLATLPLLPAWHLIFLWLPHRRIAALPWAWVAYGLTAAAMLLGLGATRPSAILIVFCLWLTLCLGYLQVVSMVTRSISLRLLVELGENPGASSDQLFRDYAAGRGFDWLLEKRLGGLEGLGLIHRDGAGLTASDRGRTLGRLMAGVKDLLALDETG